MKLAILHYHLNRGGVTRVIENQLAALDAVLAGSEHVEAAILYGGRREGWNEALAGRLRHIRLALCEVPRLEYDSISTDENPDENPREGLSDDPPALDDASAPAPAPAPQGEPRQPTGPGGPTESEVETLFVQITAALERLGFCPGETLLHVHNHSLGKNRALPVVVRRLAESGFAILLQIHDFAEDFRPTNYRHLGQLVCGDLYPGVAEERLHRLPNPVPDSLQPADRTAAREKLQQRFGIGAGERLLLMPVRCIRRKNVGEALLCSLLAPAGTVVGLTLPPLNPVERPTYERWQRLAGEANLPCVFELGVPGGLSLAENLAAADWVLTTSVAEGFGMVFLESWLAGRPLIGRNLPEVTDDFVQAGVNLCGLWQRLPVPVEWVGRERLRERVVGAYRRTLAAFGRVPGPEATRQLEAKFAAGWVDFGDLDEPMQEAVIHRACDAGRRRELAEATHAEQGEELIAANQRVIQAEYGLLSGGRRLLACYEQVFSARRGGPVAPVARPEKILDRFLSPARFLDSA